MARPEQFEARHVQFRLRKLVSLHTTGRLILAFLALGTGAAPTRQSSASNPLPNPDAGRLSPVNLHVLPKEISRDDLDRLMHRFRDELGAPCGYCHAQDAKTRRIDYASDENPVKETARLMILMTGMINDKYLARFGERPRAARVTCGDCHRGQIDPPDFEPKSRN